MATMDEVYEKLTDEEKKAVYDYAAALANSYLDVYRAGSIMGTAVGAIAALVITAGASYIARRIVETADEKAAMTSSDKTETTDSE